MRFFIENQKVEKEFAWMQAQIRLHMNGATTGQMEKSGIHYRINYGVGIPHLKQLAKRIPVSFELAERMWFSEIREMMLLAAIIVPAEKMTEDVCRLWSEQINNKDLVERTSMFLWLRIKDIRQILGEWMNGENNYLKATALYTIGRCLQAEPQCDMPSALELIKAVAKVQDLFIVKALSFALRMKLRNCSDEKEEIMKYAEALSIGKDTNRQILAQELFNEMDFINDK